MESEQINEPTRRLREEWRRRAAELDAWDPRKPEFERLAREDRVYTEDEVDRIFGMTPERAARAERTVLEANPHLRDAADA